MKKAYGFFSVFSVVILTSCGTSSFQKLEPIEQDRVYQVISEIKRQISVYTAYQRSKNGYPAVWANSRTKVCGNGLIGFDVLSVKMDLLSTSENMIGGSVGLTGAPVGASVGASRTSSATQSLIVSAEVKRSSQPINFVPSMLGGAPLARAMINLWEAAIKSGDDVSDICLKFKEISQDSNTYKMGITVTEVGNSKVSIGLANVALTASGDFKSVTGNTVTVKFGPHNFARTTEGPAPKCARGDTRPECQNKAFIRGD